MTHTTALVLAGGSGSRMGARLPKQLLELGDRTILEHAVGAFYLHPRVDDVIVVVGESHENESRALIEARFPSVRCIVRGGLTRTDSSLSGLSKMSTKTENVLIHDAARPLVSARVIDDCLDALGEFDVVEPVLPVVDTVVQVEGSRVHAILDRGSLRRVQTPQGFRRELLVAAYDRWRAEPSAPAMSDDVGVLQWHDPGTVIGLVAGEERNLKITGPHDLLVAASILTGKCPESHTLTELVRD